MSASVVFALRGNSIQARHSSAGKTPASFTSAGSVPIATGTSGFTGEIGGSSINMNLSSGANKYLMFPGGLNLPQTPGISVLMRCSLDDLTSFMGLWNIGIGGISCPGMLQLNSTNTGALAVTQIDFSFLTGINNVSVAGGLSTGTLYDIVFTWDGTTGASAANLYVNNSNIKQYTSTHGWASIAAQFQPLLSIGGFSGTNYYKGWINEFVVWSGVINPASVSCGGSNVALNGNSRSAFVDCNSFDGSVYTDPGISNVKSGTSYTFAGTSQTGTLPGGPTQVMDLNGKLYQVLTPTATIPAIQEIA